MEPTKTKQPHEIGLEEFAQALLPTLEQMQDLVRRYGCTREGGFSGRVMLVAIQATKRIDWRHDYSWQNPLPGVLDLNDHKGNLQITVDDSVSVATLSALALAWESECECSIELIYSQGGRVFSVVAGTEDVRKGLGELLIAVSKHIRRGIWE
jgi:hypothetical protein